MRKENSNKGFSLVELIIVIAIMLVLVGILAPQFVKYVHRARIAADMTSAEELAEAIYAAMAEGTEGNIRTVYTHDPEGGAVSITSSSGGVPGGTAITGLDGVTALPISKINKDYRWIVEWYDGVVKIRLQTPSYRDFYIYPEYTGD